MNAYDPRWDAALDALEAEVAQLEFGLASGNLEQIEAAGRWEPPEDLQVLPVQLAERAQHLADRMEAAERQAREIQHELKSELDKLGTRRDAAAAYISHDTQDA